MTLPLDPDLLDEIKETPPRRGRPPRKTDGAMMLDATVRAARPAVPPKPPVEAKPKPRAPRAQKNRQPGIAQLLGYVNVPLSMTPWTQPAKLDDVEILLLSRGISEEAKRSAAFAKLVDAALARTGQAGLAAIVVLIAARRLPRYGLAPSELDVEIGSLLARAVNQPGPLEQQAAPTIDEPEPEPATVPE